MELKQYAKLMNNIEQAKNELRLRFAEIPAHKYLKKVTYQRNMDMYVGECSDVDNITLNFKWATRKWRRVINQIVLFQIFIIEQAVLCPLLF